MTAAPEDTNLAERFKSGDDLALVEMYSKYSAPMYVIALRLLGDHDLASEAVQRAFVQAWRGVETFDAGRDLQPWLYAITRRAAVDVYRRQRRAARMAPLDSAAIPERDLAIDGPSFDATWRAWQVRRALDKLTPEERQVLQLGYLAGYSQSQIAAELGIALGTVKSRTARGLRRLMVLLAHLRELI
ncbi:RNA polymerase sigma factor [Kribbella sp. CA-253562]|uniref:RNA polymerase sigma factor n=1 Tax=Kribbella sp. CA-253562 TaxID=3239942 RepID=UPI003D8EECAF